MVKIIGVLKCMVSFAGLVLLILIFFNLKINGIAEKVASMAIVSSIAGIYTYYLILTGIWNLAKREYKINAVLFAGVIIHFIFIFTLIYYSYTSLPLNVLLTSLFTSAFGVAIGVFDIGKLVKSWKNRN